MARYTTLQFLMVAFSVMAVIYGASARLNPDFEAADYDEEEVDAPKIPNFTTEAQHFRVRLGDTVRLPCEVDELDPGYTLLWRREGGDILTVGSIMIIRDNRFSQEGRNTLIVRHISLADQGTYICQINTEDLRELRHVIEILVPPSVKPVPSTGLSVVSKKGEPVTLSCDVTGNPLPVVTWTREGNKKFPDGQRTMLGHTITFVKTDRHHSGVYTCTAENSEGNPDKADINLEVTYEPEVEVELNLVTVAEGYNSELTCTVHGEPKPSVSWFKNGEKLEAAGPNSPHHRYVQTSAGSSRHVLSIDNVQIHDFANYTCQGENRFGSDRKTIEMSGVPSTATLRRNKTLTDGIKLKWMTVSHTPLIEYRLRYRRPSALQWTELLLKANEKDPEEGMLFDHVHQLHGLASGMEHELTIESKNKYGWSRPLEVDFTTLAEEGVESVKESTKRPEGQRGDKETDKPTESGKSDAEIAKESKEAAKEEATGIKDTVMEKGRDVKDTVKEKSADAKESLQETGSKVAEKGKDMKEGLKDMGEGAKQSLKDTRSDIADKKQDAEKSLKDAEAEAPKKGKGLMGTIRDWVAPAADKTRDVGKNVKESIEETGSKIAGIAQDVQESTKDAAS